MSKSFEPLSITTRGIGFATCYLSYIAAIENIEPPVYALYRFFLSLAEAKVASYTCVLNEPEFCHIYPWKVLSCMLEGPQSITIAPVPIKQIIDAITAIEHNGRIYTPVVAAQVRDKGKYRSLVPRPEILLLSNLRDVLDSLGGSTPASYSAAFKANCPIPGAIWDNNILRNQEEIIPQVYNLENDMWLAINFLTRLREKYPLMASGPLLRKGTEVSKAALVTSRMGNLRAKPREVGESIADYCKRCHPLGGFEEEFYTLEKISEVDKVAGQLALLGELPNEVVLGELTGSVISVHSLRKWNCSDEFLVSGNYTTSLMKAHEALWSPAAPQPAGDEPALP